MGKNKNIVNKAKSEKSSSKTETVEMQLKKIDAQIEMDPNAELYIQKAELLQANKRYEQALDSIDKAIMFESNAKSFEIKAKSLYYLNRYEEALEYIEKAIALEPKPESYYKKSLLLYSLERYDNSLEVAEKAIELEATAKHYYIKSVVLGHLDRREEALQVIDKAIELGPDARTYSNKSIILRHLGKYEEALEYADKAVALEPDADNYSLKLHILLCIHRYEDALSAVELLLELEPTVENINEKAEILYFLGKYDDALNLINQTIDNEPKSFLYKTKAQILKSLKRTDEEREALEDADRAAEKEKNAEHFFNKLDFMWSEFRQYDDAIRTIDKVLSIEEKPKYLITKAEILKSCRRYDEALELADKAIYMEKDSHHFAVKAEILQVLRRYEEAIENLDKAIEMKPNAYNYCLRKAKLLQILGRYDDALRYTKKYAELVPNADYYVLKADLLFFMQDDYQKALDAIDEALSNEYNPILAAKKLYLLVNNDQFDKAREYYQTVVSFPPPEDDNRISFYLLLYVSAKYLNYSNKKYSDELYDIFQSICGRKGIPRPDDLGSYTKADDLADLFYSYGLLQRWYLDKNKKRFYAPHFLQVLLNIGSGNYEFARFLSNEAEPVSLTEEDRHFLNLLIKMTEPDSDFLDSQQLNSIKCLEDEHIYNADMLIDAAWKSGKVRILLDYFEEYSPQLEKHKWYNLWVNIEDKRYKEAVEIIEGFSLDNLFKETAITHKPSLDNDKDLFIPEISKIDTIGMIFDRKLPYDKLDIDLFCRLLRKLLPGFSTERFDEVLAEVLDEWANKPDNLEKFKQYGDEYKELSIKKELVERLSKGSFLGSSIYLSTLVQLLVGINDILSEKMHSIVAQARVDERNRVMSNLSHSIKNMLRAIINPLDNMKLEIPAKANIIDSALKGANLIREIVNSISLSFNTTLDDLIWDIKHPGKEKMSLQDMIKTGLDYSIANMFDFKYFNNYASNYYPASVSKEEYNKITGHWSRVASSNKLIDLIDYANQYMFDLSIEADGVAEYYVGNEKSSAIKLMILFQEIIFNAVKYASYVPKKDRFIQIKIYLKEDKVHLQVKNSYSPRVLAKTTGVGKVIIENFGKVLNCIPEIHTEGNTYTIDMEFENLWRKNAENTIR